MKEQRLQSKQQPRELKVNEEHNSNIPILILKAKEVIIRKQFRQAVKIQTRQFKAYQVNLAKKTQILILNISFIRRICFK
jgi:hypothetical protein